MTPEQAAAVSEAASKHGQRHGGATVMMLVAPGGQERTEPEYAELLAKAKFRLQRVVPTPSPVSVVEAVPV